MPSYLDSSLRRDKGREAIKDVLLSMQNPSKKVEKGYNFRWIRQESSFDGGKLGEEGNEKERMWSIVQIVNQFSHVLGSFGSWRMFKEGISLNEIMQWYYYYSLIWTIPLINEEWDEEKNIIKLGPILESLWSLSCSTADVRTWLEDSYKNNNQE